MTKLPPPNSALWDDLAKAMSHWQNLLVVNQYSLIRKPSGSDLPKTDDSFTVKVRSLYFDGNDLLDRLYFECLPNDSYVGIFFDLVRDWLLTSDCDQVWQLLSAKNPDSNNPFEENVSMCIRVLATDYFLARMGEPRQAEASLQLATNLNWKLLTEGTFTKQMHAHGGKVDEDYLTAGTNMLMLWLAAGNIGSANRLMLDRMSVIGKTAAKEPEHRYFQCLCEFIRFGLDPSQERAHAAESALLDVQLWWLRWLVRERHAGISILELVLAETIFQELLTQQPCPPEQALAGLRPPQVRQRVMRLKQQREDA